MFFVYYVSITFQLEVVRRLTRRPESGNQPPLLTAPTVYSAEGAGIILLEGGRSIGIK
jgi:hypothetical protein